MRHEHPKLAATGMSDCKINGSEMHLGLQELRRQIASSTTMGATLLPENM